MIKSRQPPDPSDRLLAAFDDLAVIVGKKDAIFPRDSDRFDRYLKDETYLKGSAGLVLIPESREEVGAIVEAVQKLRAEFPAERHQLALTLRGGGSGLSGACVPQGGIVLDLTRLNRILEIDEHNLLIRAECGIILSEINAALAGFPFHYAVDPSSLSLCTLGGSIATNAAGPSSLKYGTTRQNLATLRFLSARGELIAAGHKPTKTSMGFSLADLVCGSEGRLGIIVDADLRLTARSEELALVMAGFADESSAVDFILTLRKSGIRPKCIEIIDAYSAALVDFPLKSLSDKGAVLMIELDGTAAQIDQDIEKLVSLNGAEDWIAARDENSRVGLWNKRKSITLELKKRFPFKLGEDIAVPLTALAATTQFARQKAADRGIKTAIWGHAGDGNLHVNYLLEDSGLLPVLETLMQELAHEVMRVDGAISGEHGLGRLKKKIARGVMPAEYFAMQQKIKTAFDPEHLFNPALELY